MKNYHLWNPCTDVQEISKVLNIGPITIVRGEGVYVYNEQGKKYINAGASLWNVAVGHGRKELAEAAREQMEKLAYSSCHEQTNIPAVKLAEKLCSMTGNAYDMVYLACNGADAVETSIKAARQYFRQHENSEFHGKYKIISFEESYHGASFAAISTSSDPYNEKMYGPLLEGFIKVTPPHSYHNAYGSNIQSECERRCLEYIEELFKNENADTIAAFIAEPVMGCAGVVPFSDNFFEELIDLCHKNNILFIADEVSTGFGRTGRMFVSEKWRVTPDMMCLSKGISSGYLPLSAVMATEEVFSKFRSKGSRFEHGYTASGHPVCCAVALRNIRIIEEEQLCKNSAEVGEYLFGKIDALRSTRPCLGDVRGRGLMIGMELVTESGEPLPEEETYKIMTDCAMMGMLLYYEKNILALFPPLILTKETADEIAEILEKALDLSKSGLLKRKKRALKVFSDNLIKQNNLSEV